MNIRAPRALVVYGYPASGTAAVARAIAAALEETFDVRVGSTVEIPVSDAAHADLLVVGAPAASRFAGTHIADEAEAINWSHDVVGQLQLKVLQRASGIHQWMSGLTEVGDFCAFDTRADLPRLLPGPAASGIVRELRRRGGHQVARPKSFLLTPDPQLAAFEQIRASIWGEDLARSAARLVAVG